jgi:hypothetical protein
MNASAAPWTTAALAAGCAGLGAIVALEMSGGLSLAPEVTAAAPSTSQLDWSPAPVEFEPPSPDGLDDITARPVFSPSRRPFVITEEAPEPVADLPLPPLQLIGVLLTEQQRTALVQEVGVGKPSWVREGADIQGWHVETIEQSRVHLSAGDRLETVELRPDTATPANARPKRRERRREAADEAAAEPSNEAAADAEAEADPDPELEVDENEGG